MCILISLHWFFFSYFFFKSLLCLYITVNNYKPGRELWHVLTACVNLKAHPLPTAPSCLLRVSYSGSKYCQTHFANVQSHLWSWQSISSSKVNLTQSPQPDVLDQGGAHSKRKTKTKTCLFFVQFLFTEFGISGKPCTRPLTKGSTSRAHSQ